MKKNAHTIFLLLLSVFLTSLGFLPVKCDESGPDTSPPGSGHPGTGRQDILVVGGAKIDVIFDNTLSEQLHSESLDWIKNSAVAVSNYFGKFPVKRFTVLVHVREGHGFGLGSSDLHHGKPTIDLPLGRETDEHELKEDWVLTHEMVHLAFPLVMKRDRWLVEGMATYVEPFARLQVGQLSAQEVWGDLFKNCREGLARDKEESLRKSRRIRRIYWGGATFCLIADLELRKKTNNKYGLQDALSAISKAGATIKSNLEPRKALALGDKALAVNTLVALYDKLSVSTENPNLESLFASLGVKEDHGQISFDDLAPLAAWRRSIDAKHR